MLLKDTKTQAHIAKGDILAQHSLQGQANVEQRRSDYRIAERSGMDPTNLMLQMGSSMFTRDFVKKLKPILPSLVWEVHPKKKDKSLFYHHDKLITIGDFPWMPEWSVFQQSYERLPAHSPDTIITKEGYEVEYFHPGVPTMETVAVGFFEVNRGWRTVLLRLFLNGLLNVTQVENIFGKGNRASWAATLTMYKIGPNDLVF